MSDEHSWSEARLIPTSGISGPDEQERRAVSALMAVLSAVREFGRAITGPLGAPSGQVQAFIEVPFTLDGRRIFPDGLIRITRAGRTWTALVEVKTGNNELKTEQLETYLDVARANGFQALLTISNEIPSAVGSHPTAVDGRKLRTVSLHHLSWSEVLAAAVMQREFRGVADPEQAWILGELIRYLEHPKSGALSFDDMGPAWVTVRDAIAAGTLRANDKAAAEIAGRFDALIRFACLQLGRRLGAEVTPDLRKSTGDRTALLTKSLVSDGILSASIRIPNAISVMRVEADLRATRVTAAFDVDAPRDGRPTTRVNWLTRQLKDSSESLRLEAFVPRSRDGSAALLREVRGDPAVLIPAGAKELKAFRVAHSQPLGPKRGRGRGAFIDSVLDSIDTAYTEIGQRLRPWTGSPPRLRSDEEVEVEPDIREDLPSNAISSRDEPEPASEPVPNAQPAPGTFWPRDSYRGGAG